MSAVKSPFRVNVADVPVRRVEPPSQGAPSPVEVRMVYGTDTGMMLARRNKGYHSRPHFHDSEQFNYVLEGEIWFFIGDDGFRCRQGDLVRVPRKIVHWTWVRSEAGCTMVETHTPSLTGDPELAKGAMPLVAPGEVADQNGVDNIFIEYPRAKAIEERALAADPD